MNIGYVESAEEDDNGPFVKCVVDTEGPAVGPSYISFFSEGRIDCGVARLYTNDADHKDGKTYIKMCRCLRCSGPCPSQS